MGKKPKIENKKLEIGNLMLCIMEVAPQRCIVGESYLHYLVWKITQHKAFDDFSKQITINYDENRPWSPEVHKAIRVLSKDFSEMRTIEETKIPMILTETLREGYEEVREAERWMDVHFKEPTKPRTFILTPNGVLVAAYSWSALLTEEQQDIIDKTVKDIIHI